MLDSTALDPLRQSAVRTVLTFDIETVPDTDTGRRLYDLDGLDDADVARAMFAQRRKQTGESEFLPLHLHRVVAIAVALRTGDSFRLWSLGEAQAPERELVARFFDGIDRYTPTLVSWNGCGFDLPVLHYRALKHGVRAPRYWDTGDDDREFRFNNYLSRYHSRHTDLMDVLAGYQPRASAPLEQVAAMLGLPGKMGASGADVWDWFLAGRIEHIRRYCETDTLNTYLVFLRWLLIRGELTDSQWQDETRLVRASLTDSDRPHLHAFLEAWPAG